jgi:hypothetical protein
MRCAEWEERVALYAGGDVERGAAEIERHLRECAACRAFAAELRESLALLRAAHAEEIPAAAFTAVRARVLERLSRPWWKRAWVYAAAAIVLLAAGIAFHVRQAPLPRGADHRLSWSANPPRVEDRRLSSLAGQLAGDKKRSPAPHRARRRTKTETILVKIETGNPDVVIYWIAETKGEE